MLVVHLESVGDKWWMLLRLMKYGLIILLMDHLSHSNFKRLLHNKTVFN
jgi:hypothetical protein